MFVECKIFISRHTQRPNCPIFSGLLFSSILQNSIEVTKIASVKYTSMS